MLLCSSTVLWSIIGDAGLFVSSVVRSAQVPLSFHILTGNMGSRPGLSEKTSVASGKDTLYLARFPLAFSGSHSKGLDVVRSAMDSPNHHVALFPRSDSSPLTRKTQSTHPAPAPSSPPADRSATTATAQYCPCPSRMLTTVVVAGHHPVDGAPAAGVVPLAGVPH